MMRRVFIIKNLGAVSTLVTLSPDKFNKSFFIKENLPIILSDFSLTEFGRDQEESPSLVSIIKEDAWLFSLRRKAFPDETLPLCMYGDSLLTLMGNQISLTIVSIFSRAFPM